MARNGEADVARVCDEGLGSSLLYGEVLPAGVVLLSEALFSVSGQRSEGCCPQVSSNRLEEDALQIIYIYIYNTDEYKYLSIKNIYVYVYIYIYIIYIYK